MSSAESTLRTPNSAFRIFIGAARFELTTFCSQNRRATKLHYAPKRPSAQTALQIIRSDALRRKPFLSQNDVRFARSGFDGAQRVNRLALSLQMRFGGLGVGGSDD